MPQEFSQDGHEKRRSRTRQEIDRPLIKLTTAGVFSKGGVEILRGRKKVEGLRRSYPEQAKMTVIQLALKRSKALGGDVGEEETSRRLCR